MIAVDTNILVYSHRRDSRHHTSARKAVFNLAGTSLRWAIPWPCLHEFFGIVTHPRIYSPPSSTNQAIDQIEAWLAAPNVFVLSEISHYWESLRPLLLAGRIVGAKVHDAKIASICETHGVEKLWTADRDFSLFPNLRTENPLVLF